MERKFGHGPKDRLYSIPATTEDPVGYVMCLRMSSSQHTNKFISIWWYHKDVRRSLTVLTVRENQIVLWISYLSQSGS